jgi:hypothetical protein
MAHLLDLPFCLSESEQSCKVKENYGRRIQGVCGRGWIGPGLASALSIDHARPRVLVAELRRGLCTLWDGCGKDGWLLYQAAVSPEDNGGKARKKG